MGQPNQFPQLVLLAKADPFVRSEHPIPILTVSVSSRSVWVMRALFLGAARVRRGAEWASCQMGGL